MNKKYTLYTNKNIYNPKWQLSDFMRSMEKTFKTKMQFVEEKPNGPKSINLIFVLATWIRDNPEWLPSLKGKNIIIEHDSYMNFLKNSPFYKFWTNLYNKGHFGMLICSGKKITEQFKEEGLHCEWVPKGCADYFFSYKNKYTGEIGCFAPPFGGRKTSKFISGPPKLYNQPAEHYKSRYEMIGILSKFDKIRTISAPYREWPELMTNISAVCMNDKSMNEPMAKHFECSALGVVPIRDRQNELLDLGYDDKSMIIYDNMEDLKDILRYYFKNPEKLIPIQKAAVKATLPHTWDARCNQILSILK